MKYFLLFTLSVFSFLFYQFHNIDKSNYESNYYKTIRENYKFIDKNEELNISYKGLYEFELFNRYSKLEADKNLLINYVSFLNTKTTFKEVINKQNFILDNIKDQDLKKSLKLTFNGIDLSLYEFPNYKYHCNQNKIKMLIDFMIFVSIFIIFSLFILFVPKFVEKEENIKIESD